MPVFNVPNIINIHSDIVKAKCIQGQFKVHILKGLDICGTFQRLNKSA